MPTMTKATIITWVSEAAQTSHTELNAQRDIKLREMYAAGKTDANAHRISAETTVREWVDQAAAQEFIDFMLALDAQYGPGLIASTVIEDAN
jgi:hypothetical protein